MGDHADHIHVGFRPLKPTSEWTISHSKHPHGESYRDSTGSRRRSSSARAGATPTVPRYIGAGRVPRRKPGKGDGVKFVTRKYAYRRHRRGRCRRCSSLLAGSAQAALKAPGLQAPAASASVESLPTFTWRAVKGAAQYEFQLSADARFGSIVLGKGKGKRLAARRATPPRRSTRPFPTASTSGACARSRKADRAGKWSQAARADKGVEGDAQARGARPTSCPSPGRRCRCCCAGRPCRTRRTTSSRSRPTRRSRRASPHRQPPLETQATVFALQGTLPAGRYYWAITPIDADGPPRDALARRHRSRGRGRRRRRRASTTSTTALAVVDPLLDWDRLPAPRATRSRSTPTTTSPPARACAARTRVLGTSLSPLRVLPNNNDFGGSSGYHWRVRAFDADGNPGQWNRGPTFEKSYDDVTPTVPNLNVETVTTADAATASPLVTWDPVPGAAQYQVQWTEHEGGICELERRERADQDVRARMGAAVAARARRAFPAASASPRRCGPTAPLRVPDSRSRRSGRIPRPRSTKLRGRHDVLRARPRAERRLLPRERQRREPGHQPLDAVRRQRERAGVHLRRTAGIADRSVAGDRSCRLRRTCRPSAARSVTARRSCAGRPVAGARRYFVLIARDSNFTNVIDAAFTAMPATCRTSCSRTSRRSYFWAVVPASQSDGSGISGGPTDYNPQSFRKLSDAARPDRAGARRGRRRPSRASAGRRPRPRRSTACRSPPTRSSAALVDDVITASTAYTSQTPYPADTALYWRVRAEQQQVLQGERERVELRWSPTGSFRRRLPVPVPDGGNPMRGRPDPRVHVGAGRRRDLLRPAARRVRRRRDRTSP